MKSSKEKYIEFIQDEYVPLFYRDWYLDAVCDEEWDVVLYLEEDKIVASWVYMLKQKLGIKYIIPPRLCPYMGPIFHDVADIQKVCGYLISQLPSHHLMTQDFFHNVPRVSSNPLIVEEKYSYIIPSGTDSINLNLSKTTRRNIKKSERLFTVSEQDSGTLFYDFLYNSFTQRNKKNPYDKETFLKLDQELKKHGCRKITQCIDKDGQTLAMEYLLMDEKWVYNFSNATNKIYTHGGVTYLLWIAINESLDSGRSFDFEGSIIPSIEKFYRSFGGEKKMYQSIHYTKNKLIDLLVRIKKSTEVYL